MLLSIFKMNQKELNDLIRSVVRKLVDDGYKKSVVGKILLGSNSYAPLIKFVDDENLEFGYKPLNKIGNTIKYNLQLIYVKPSEIELIKLIRDSNINFSIDLYNNINEFLKFNKLNSIDKEKNKKVADDVLQSIISSILDE